MSSDFNAFLNSLSKADLDAPFTRARELQIPGAFQFPFVETVEEEQCENIRDNDKSIDEYWAKGWIVQYCFMKRVNFDLARGVFVKAFPTRYCVPNFSFSKSMRRTLAKNSDLECVVRPLRITPAKEKLFHAHHLNRFGALPKEPLSKTYKWVQSHPARMLEMSFFCGNELVAFSIFELGAWSIYSHMGVWKPGEEHRGLGTLTILKDIEYARSHNRYYYYLGPVHLHTPNLVYKMRFRGLELYDWDNEQWVKWGVSRIAEMLVQLLPLKEYK